MPHQVRRASTHTGPRRRRFRLAAAATVVVGVVLALGLSTASYGGTGTGRAGDLLGASSQPSAPRVREPSRNDSISRSPEAASAPAATTPEQEQRAVRAVRRQRQEPVPSVVPLPKPADRTAVPGNRYAMAGGCYALRGPDGWVQRSGGGYATSAGSAGQAEPFRFQATDLGSYLLYDSGRQFLASATPPAVTRAAKPDDAGTVWTVNKTRRGFTFTQGGRGLTGGNPLTTSASATAFGLRLVPGCAQWPEVTTNIGGRTYRGVSGFQEVFGTSDAHTHGMAFEFLGGAHCGRPWSPFGVTVALVDCPDHQTGTNPLEAALSGRPTHDPVGWPTFKDWPAPDSLTHEGTYYKWVERAYQGGLRLFVNLLVENGQLCKVYPYKTEKVATGNPTCDEMTTLRWEAQDMRAMERYIDAQYGGPGKGWYRIVTNPFQARKVINEGKLAVVMGMETSVPFGCSTIANPVDYTKDIPECTAAQIDRQMNEIYGWGVRQMQLVNKFDNALAGVAGDSGAIGPVVNGGNFLETQDFWKMRTCDPSYGPGVEDRQQPTTPVTLDPQQQDALFGAMFQVFGQDVLPDAPVYPYAAPLCNQRGLTTLGRQTIRGIVDRGMIFDPDHMSVKARKSSLDLLERLKYSGVISSHSWSTPDAYPRILRLGGVVTPYAGNSTSFVDKWRQTVQWADPRYYFGLGYGADINGLGAQGDPRGAGAPNPVTYPFTGWGGVTVNQQVSGQRVYDINRDGVAQYGLYPDWWKDLENLAGPNITQDMQRGAEAYLQMWERAVGVSNDACRQPSAAKRASLIRNLPRGTSVRQVLMRAGQPHERLGDTFTYCAERANGTATQVQVQFTPSGRLRRVR